MKKWMVVAALALAIVAVFLVARSGRPPAAPPAAPAPMGAQAGPATGEAPQHGGPPAEAPPPGAAAGSGSGPNPHDGSPPPPPAAPTADELRVLASISGYQVTLKRLEAYVVCVRAIREAGQKDPELMAQFRAIKPPPYQQAELAAWLEAIKPLKAILDRHGFTGMDLILMPQAVVLGQVAHARIKAGEKLRPEETNATSQALHESEPKRMAELTADFASELRIIEGR